MKLNSRDKGFLYGLGGTYATLCVAGLILCVVGLWPIGLGLIIGPPLLLGLGYGFWGLGKLGLYIARRIEDSLGKREATDELKEIGKLEVCKTVSFNKEGFPLVERTFSGGQASRILSSILVRSSANYTNKYFFRNFDIQLKDDKENKNHPMIVLSRKDKSYYIKVNSKNAVGLKNALKTDNFKKAFSNKEDVNRLEKLINGLTPNLSATVANALKREQFDQAVKSFSPLAGNVDIAPKTSVPGEQATKNSQKSPDDKNSEKPDSSASSKDIPFDFK